MHLVLCVDFSMSEVTNDPKINIKRHQNTCLKWSRDGMKCFSSEIASITHLVASLSFKCII